MKIKLEKVSCVSYLLVSNCKFVLNWHVYSYAEKVD